MSSTVEKRTCRECKTEYVTSYYDVLGLHILRGDGYCPTCAKEVYDREMAKEEATRQTSIAMQRRQCRETCGIPPKYLKEDFSTFKQGWQDKAFKVCWDYAENFPIEKKRGRGYLSLFLWSKDSWGTGKTHLAAAILHRILDRWQGEEHLPRVMFISEPDLFRRIQNTYSFSQEERRIRESESDIINGIIHADLVVLDDVGKEPRTDMHFVRRTLFAIINGRYDRELPLIITANLAPLGLKSHLDEPPTEASFNRFFEMIGGKHTRMDGRSFRSQK